MIRAEEWARGRGKAVDGRDIQNYLFSADFRDWLDFGGQELVKS
jgi:hypothetical protein